MGDWNIGPIYGVRMIDTLPLDGGQMLQAMPSRTDLERVRKHSERTVAGYEVLLEHYHRLQAIVDAKLHIRRCHDCGHEFYAADGVVPYCLCEKCGSQDTRRIAAQEPANP